MGVKKPLRSRAKRGNCGQAMWWIPYSNRSCARVGAVCPYSVDQSVYLGNPVL